MIESLNLFDLFVFGVLGLSAILSFFRGFLREVLSLGAWVGASVITLYAFPHVAEQMTPHVKSPTIASGFAAMGTFMLALFAISIFNSLLLRYTKSSSEIGLLDNGMGLIFGLARGALLISLGYFVMTITMAKEDYPPWVKTAKSQPYAEKGAGWIASVAPEYFNAITPAGLGTPELDKAIRRGEDEVEEAGDDADWQSMEELQRRMHEESED